MQSDWTKLVAAALIGATLAWILLPRRVVVPRKKGAAVRHLRGPRTVDDIAAKLEYERVLRENRRIDRAAKAPVRELVGAAPVRSALPAWDPGAFSLR